MMITARTRTYGVIGNPVAHSLSPLMHNAAFAETGHDGVYLAFQVEAIADAVRGIRALGIRGASITIPHKVSVLPLLDELDDLARDIGAVNTIVNRDGRLTGFNTDCLGAVRALEEKTPLGGKEVLIVGAGGAARAVGFGIIRAGGIVTITNRSEGRGRDLAGDLHASFSKSGEIVHRPWDIIINTTSVGMTPETDRIPVPEETLRPGCVVMDIVYNPLETRLLTAASENGCVTVDGAAMFVYQGVCQFELWTGMSAPVASMNRRVREALSPHKK